MSSKKSQFQFEKELTTSNGIAPYDSAFWKRDLASSQRVDFYDLVVAAGDNDGDEEESLSSQSLFLGEQEGREYICRNTVQ